MKGKRIKLRDENVREYFLEMRKNLFEMTKTAQITRKTKVLLETHKQKNSQWT